MGRRNVSSGQADRPVWIRHPLFNIHDSQPFLILHQEQNSGDNLTVMALKCRFSTSSGRMYRTRTASLKEDVSSCLLRTSHSNLLFLKNILLVKGMFEHFGFDPCTLFYRGLEA